MYRMIYLSYMSLTTIGRRIPQFLLLFVQNIQIFSQTNDDEDDEWRKPSGIEIFYLLRISYLHSFGGYDLLWILNVIAVLTSHWRQRNLIRFKMGGDVLLLIHTHHMMLRDLVFSLINLCDTMKNSNTIMKMNRCPIHHSGSIQYKIRHQFIDYWFDRDKHK